MVERVKFGEIAKLKKTNVSNPSSSGYERFVGLENMQSSVFKVNGHSDSSNLVSTAKVFEKGDILFARRNTYLKRVSIADFDGVCSGDTYVLNQCTSNKVIPGFLPILMRSPSFWVKVISRSAGTMSKRIKWSELETIEFDIPDIDTQTKVLAFMNGLEKSKNSCLSLIKSIALAKSTSIKSFLFSKDGNPCYEMIKASELFLNEPKNGFSPKTNALEKGFKTFSISAITNGRVVIDSDNEKFADIDENDCKKFFINVGDILVVRGNGNRNLVGRAGINKDKHLNTFYPDILIRLSPDKKRYLPDLFVELWNSYLVRKQIYALAQTTNGTYKINKDIVNAIKLPNIPFQNQGQLLGLLKNFNDLSDEITKKMLSYSAMGDCYLIDKVS